MEFDYFGYACALSQAEAQALRPPDDEDLTPPDPLIGLNVRWSPDCEQDNEEIGEVIRPSTCGQYTVRFPIAGDRLLDPCEWEVVR